MRWRLISNPAFNEKKYIEISDMSTCTVIPAYYATDSVTWIFYLLQPFICKAFKTAAIVLYCTPLITVQMEGCGKYRIQVQRSIRYIIDL